MMDAVAKPPPPPPPTPPTDGITFTALKPLLLYTLILLPKFMSKSRGKSDNFVGDCKLRFIANSCVFALLRLQLFTQIFYKIRFTPGWPNTKPRRQKLFAILDRMFTSLSLTPTLTVILLLVFDLFLFRVSIEINFVFSFLVSQFFSQKFTCIQLYIVCNLYNFCVFFVSSLTSKKMFR